MNKEIITRRIRAIRRELSKRNIDCLIVTKPANVTYTTGFLGTDSWAVITRAKVYFLTDSRYTEQAEVECKGCTIVERTGLMPEAIGKLIKKLKSVQSVSVEESISLADFKALKKQVKVRIKSVANIIENVRSSKDSTEIKTIEAAASISAQALKKTLRYIKPGITESELAGMLNFQIRKLGATNGFETIVAFGQNGSRPHHQPSQRKLKKKDTVLIDFGAKYNGYCSDITRCFVVGGATAFYKKVYDVVEQAQAAAIKMMKAGADMIDVDSAARTVIKDSGLPVYAHGSGHGFGLEIHEIPFLKVKGKGNLKAGQVITIEPGIYIPGKLGVRIEDDVLVTEKGYKILTSKCPHRPYLLGRKR
jgi:Xaa-Pro aminopeptidase